MDDEEAARGQLGASPRGGAADDRAASSAARSQQDTAAAVDSGRFAIAPGTAQRAAQVCRDHGTRLKDLQREIDELGTLVPFGECKVGEQLAAKFADKAVSGPQSLAALLSCAEQIVENLAQSYAKAEAGYTHLDAGGAARVQRAQQV